MRTWAVRSDRRISFVVTSRNDDHGGNMLRRFRIFADGLLEQVQRHGLRGELIIVEWNPPAGPRLHEVLQLKPTTDDFAIRFIEVPPEAHQAIRNSDVIPLFQMTAKNVGIRRAVGDFVIATNPDVLFSDALISFLAHGNLREDVMYRLDRIDVAADVPEDIGVAAQLAWCERHILRVHEKNGSFEPGEERTLAYRLGLWCRQALQQVRDLTRSWARAARRTVLEAPAAWLLSRLPELVRPWAQAARRVLLEVPATWLVCRLPALVGRDVRAAWRVLVARPTRVLVAVTGRLGRAIVRAPSLAWALLSSPRKRRRALQEGYLLLTTLLGETRRAVARAGRAHRRLVARLTGAARRGTTRVALTRRWLVAGLVGIATWAGRLLFALLPRKVRRALTRAYILHGPRRVVRRAVGLAVRKFLATPRVHTNGCGDFTMLARSEWFRLRGYPELPLWSMHLDSFLCFMAVAAGIREQVLNLPCAMYHLEHGRSWVVMTPEERLRTFATKPWIDIALLNEIWEAAYWREAPIIVNDERWGLADWDLKEVVVTGGEHVSHSLLPVGGAG